MQMTQKDTCDQLFQFIDISCTSEALSEYLSFIYHDLVSRCQKPTKNLTGLLFSTFASYMSLPLIISEKLFKTLDFPQKNYLTEEEFVGGLTTIYKGSTSQVISLVSSIFDFDKDGEIQLQDVSLLLSHLQLIKIETKIELINDIISNFFNGTSRIAKNLFEEKAIDVNSDVICLFLYFLALNKPFHVDNIKYMEKLIDNNHHVDHPLTSATNSRLSLCNPSLSFECFLSYSLKYTLTTDQNLICDLKLLEDFEKDFHDASSLMLDQGLVQNENSLSFLSNTKMKCKDYFIYPKNLANHISSSTNADSYLDCIEQTEVLAYLVVDNSLKKYKLKLLQDDIFCFKYDQNNRTEKLESVMNLKFSIIEKCERIAIKGKTFFPFLVNANYDFQILAWNYLCEEKGDMEHFVEQIKKAIQCRTFGLHYELVSDMGHGQFGKVKLGINRNTKEKVAIKIIKKSQITEEFAKMVRWEIDIFKFLQKVNHPGIIRAIDYFESTNTIYLVFELMNEGNLNEYLEGTNSILCSEQLQKISFQVMNALDFLHSYGIVHRDLKPENILIHKHNNDIQVKLIDFGLSKVMGLFDNAKESYGSLCYSAPEILMGKCYNHKVDVWSFGVMLYYLHYAKLPFDDSKCNLPKITKKIILGKFDFSFSSTAYLTEEEVSIQAFIRSCLVHKISNRPSIPQLLETGLYSN